jgi:hypothetical protein
LSSSKVRDAAIFLLLSIILVLVSDFNGFTDIAVDNLGLSLFIYLIPATIGSLLVFLASSALVYSNLLRRLFMGLGKNSQEVYEIHPVFFYLAAIVALPLGLPLFGLEHSTLFWPLRFILGITIGFLFTKYIITRNRILSVLFRGFPRISPTKPAMETSPSDA